MKKVEAQVKIILTFKRTYIDLYTISFFTFSPFAKYVYRQTSPHITKYQDITRSIEKKKPK